MELLNLTYAESSVDKLVHALLEFYNYHGIACSPAVLCKQRKGKLTHNCTRAVVCRVQAKRSTSCRRRSSWMSDRPTRRAC
jgi:hypothetical protein